jgi:hypothetical protein
MAKYRATLRDAAPFLRRNALRSTLSAFVIVAVAVCFGVLAGGGVVGLTSFGMGLGVAISIAAEAFRDYQRAKVLYGAEAEAIELTVTPEAVVFTTDVRQTTIRRGPKVQVVESRGAFVITAGNAVPVLVPGHYLTSEEIQVLRQWARA